MTATLPAPSFDQVVAEVRQACAEAEREGRPRPGRPTLVRLTGATDHQVRQALARLEAEPDSLPPVVPPGVATGTNRAPTAGGRLVAWLGFVFGSLMSIAANVLHTWLPAATMPPDWSPGIAPQVGAAVWPVALLLAVEVLSRVAWGSGWWWLARYGGAGTVAAGSAVISYGHVRDVLLAWGYGHPGADVGPLVLDGLMVVSGFALLAMAGDRPGRSRQRRQ